MKYLILVFLFATPYLLSAQPKAVKDVNDPEAEKYLKALQEKYKQMPFAFDFSVKVTAEKQKDVSFDGNYTGLGEKYQVTTQDGTSYFNGSELWTINNKDMEITASTPKKSKEKIESPMDIVSQYQKLYKYRVKETPNAQTVVLELIPKNKYVPYFKIDLVIDKPKMQIKNAKLYYRDGTRMAYTISNIRENVILPTNYFEVNKTKYPGYDFIDLGD